MINNAIAGDYKIVVDYFNDNVQKISGPTILKATIITNYGKINEESKTKIYKLDESEGELEIGTLHF
ncbi:DUF2135 domain-containing protein [Croceibacter atlanticus]